MIPHYDFCVVAGETSGFILDDDGIVKASPYSVHPFMERVGSLVGLAQVLH
jgi:hypothetical protein